MSIDKFMEVNGVAIDSIIQGLPKEFDSHDFIKRFARRFETDYIDFLSQYQTEPFKTVHAQIAKFLSENDNQLKIQSIGQIHSENVFGDKTINENWMKV